MRVERVAASWEWNFHSEGMISAKRRSGGERDLEPCVGEAIARGGSDLGEGTVKEFDAAATIIGRLARDSLSIGNGRLQQSTVLGGVYWVDPVRRAPRVRTRAGRLSRRRLHDPRTRRADA